MAWAVGQPVSILACVATAATVAATRRRPFATLTALSRDGRSAPGGHGVLSRGDEGRATRDGGGSPQVAAVRQR